MAQLLQCDKAAFARLGTQVTNVRQREDGTYPFGEALLALRQDPNIALFLMPLVLPQLRVQLTGHTRTVVVAEKEGAMANGRRVVAEAHHQCPLNCKGSGTRVQAVNQFAMDTIARVDVLRKE